MKGARFSKCFGALLLGFLVFPGQTLGGSIIGKVVFVGAVPAPKKLDVTIDQYLCGEQKDAEDLILSRQKEIRNAVVWLENPPPSAVWPAQAKPVEMDQKGCVYIPRMVVVPVGGTVNFLNSDRLLHNIHAAPKLNASFNLTQPKNRTLPITFTKPEIVRILCDLHPWMMSWVVVAAHLSTRSPAGTDSSCSTTSARSVQIASLARTPRHSSGECYSRRHSPAPLTVEMKAP